MAHQVVVTDESYIFRSATKTKLYILLGVGVFLFVLGLVLAMNTTEDSHHGGGHGALQKEQLLASTQQDHAAAAVE
jgi:hypothetical protein